MNMDFTAMWETFHKLLGPDFEPKCIHCEIGPEEEFRPRQEEEEDYTDMPSPENEDGTLFLTDEMIAK